MYKKSKYLLIVILSLLLVGCNSNSDDNSVKNLSDINQKILFTFEYSNYAYGFTYQGSYIDNEGNVYDFEIPDIETYDLMKKQGFINSLLMLKDKKLVGTVDKKMLLKQYNNLLKVNKNAKIKKKLGDSDVGIQAWYGELCNEDGSYDSLLISEDGEYNAYNTDRYAKKIKKWLGSGPIHFFDKGNE